MLPSCNEMCGSSNDWLPHLALYVLLRSCYIIHIPKQFELKCGVPCWPRRVTQGACWLHLHKIHIPGTQIDGLIAFLALITSILMLDVSTNNIQGMLFANIWSFLYMHCHLSTNAACQVRAPAPFPPSNSIELYLWAISQLGCHPLYPNVTGLNSLCEEHLLCPPTY